MFILLSTINNKLNSGQKISFSKINSIEVSGLSNVNNFKVSEDLNTILYENIFLINKENFNKILSKNNLIESFYVKKIYPNLVHVKLKKTNFIGITIKNNQNFYIGSNGKLIKYEDEDTKKFLPFVFGNNFGLASSAGAGFVLQYLYCNMSNFSLHLYKSSTDIL